MTATSIDLQSFCDDKISRYNLGSPWVYGGWRYATDGRICVRMPCIEPDTLTLPDERIRPLAYKLFTGRNFGYCRKPFPRCPKCLGEKGHRCARCHGAGKIPSDRICRACQGTKLVPQDIMIGDRKFYGWLLAIVGRLPEVRIWEGGDPHGPMQFTAAGALQGLVMPKAKE